MHQVSKCVIPIVFVGLLLNLSSAYAAEDRVKVLPIFFIPQDVHPTSGSIDKAIDLLGSHLKLAQKHYKSLLKTDTFQVSKTLIYRGRHDSQRYVDKQNTAEVDTAHTITRELFTWLDETRSSSQHVYLVVYVRLSDKPYNGKTNIFGGGRPFNGPPGSGGGYIEMEYTSLSKEQPYPFQSTLVHELGHSFGLVHVDAYKLDMKKDPSIMSWNHSHHSRGLKQSSEPGIFNPEDYLALSHNKRVFPNFEYIEKVHNPTGRKVTQVYLGPMKESIGKIEHQLGVGYELFHNAKRVNGPEAAFFTIDQAKKNCDWNFKNRPRTKIECRYNGSKFK